MLSIGSSGKDTTSSSEQIEQSLHCESRNGQQLATSGEPQQGLPATAATSPSMARLEKQRLQVISGEVELLTRRSQQLSMEVLTHERPPPGASPDPSNAAANPEHSEQVEPPSNCLLPAHGSAKQLQQQSSFKKSTFFQGFRYTLKGRRGSKQVDKQQQELATVSSAEQQQGGSGSIQQSHSLSSISGQPASRLSSFGTSKKFRHKLLLAAVGGSASQSGTPSLDSSPSTLAGPDSSPKLMSSEICQRQSSELTCLEQVNKCQMSGYTSSASMLSQTAEFTSSEASSCSSSSTVTKTTTRK